MSFSISSISNYNSVSPSSAYLNQKPKVEETEKLNPLENQQEDFVEAVNKPATEINAVDKAKPDEPRHQMSANEAQNLLWGFSARRVTGLEILH